MEAWRSELYHHGILGQRWGKRNGPPYPLGANKHSASEKKAGWRKSLDKKSGGKYTKGSSSSPTEKTEHHLTDKQKKALIIGAAVAATALATYGAYKLGAFDSLKGAGEKAMKTALGEFGDTPLPELPKINVDEKGPVKHTSQHESVDSVLQKVNPTGSHHNCYNVVTATVARLCGIDVTAKGDTQGGKGLSFDEVCRVFKLNPDNEFEVRRIQNPTLERIKNQIEKRYSEGDVGAIGLTWKDGGGHTLNWVVKDGKAEFLDGQVGIRGEGLARIISLQLSQDKEVSVAKFGNIIDGLNLETDVDMQRFINMVD